MSSPSTADGERAMAIAIATPAQDASVPRTPCDVILLISSAAGYERRRSVVRKTYLSLLTADASLARRIKCKFLVGAPATSAEVAALEAEEAEHGDLLQVAVPESYDMLFPKLVAAWHWAVATHDFTFFMSADDDSYIRLDLVARWIDSPLATPPTGIYAGYIWDGSDGRRTRPLRDPTAKSYMPHEQWPHDNYPPFASGCGFLLAHDLVASLVEMSPTFTFFRVVDVPVGVFLSRLPEGRVRILHLDEVRAYRPLPLFRPETMVQHYMQPEEFRSFHERAIAAAAANSPTAAGMGGAVAAAGATSSVVDDSEQRIAAVYELFVQAKVMRR